MAKCFLVAALIAGMLVSLAHAQFAPIKVSSKLTIQVPIKTRELLRTVNSSTVDKSGAPYQIGAHTWTAGSIDPGAVTKDPPAGMRYIFYSNRPEQIVNDNIGTLPNASCFKSQCLADAPSPRAFLLEQVSGLGQIFSWHANSTSSAINHGIVVRNTNNFAVHVASNHWATMDSDQDSNSAAWLTYTQMRRLDQVIQPGQQAILFRHGVPANGGVFGLVAEMEVTRQSDLVTPASVWAADIAWQNDAAAGLPNAYDYSQAATVNGNGWERGLGHRYETYLTLNTANADISSGPQVYKLGGLECAKGGYSNDDGSGIALDSPDGEPFVAALYGRSVTVHWPLVNRSAAKVHVRVAIGNSCMPADGAIGFALRYPSGNVIAIDNLLGGQSSGNYVDILEADIGPGEVWEVGFQLFPSAPRILPVTVGAYVTP